MRAGTSDTRVRGIVASAFVAGIICAGTMSLPTFSAPPPEPYFGLDEAPGEADAARQKPQGVRDAAGRRLGPAVLETAPGPNAPKMFSAADETGGAPLRVDAAPAAAAGPDASLRLLMERVRLARREPPVPSAGPSTASAAAQTNAQTGADVRAPEPRPAPPEPAPPAPLPGDEWVENGPELGADMPVGTGDDVAAAPPSEPRRRGRILDLLDDGRTSAARAGVTARPSQTGPLGGRLLDRLRPDRWQSRPAASAETPPPSPDAWPRPDALFAQLDALRGSSPGHGDAAVAAATWSERAIDAVHAVLATGGPRDPAADREILACSEHLPAAMAAAETISDPSLATQTRRAGFALARRTAVWRAATACLQSPADPVPAGLGPDVAGLLAAIEGFETAPSQPAAAAVRRSLADAGKHEPRRTLPLAQAVGEHYRAPNVRVAVHRRLVERLLPEATVTSAPLEDFILGRRVHGTRTVEQSLGVRFAPDPDEIRFELLVSGEVTSRTVTDAGPVSLHSRGAAVFTVRKPVVLSARGLAFGPAVGVASNQSQLATVQTSFDAVPIMGSLARTIARREHDESMPEATREVNAHIISRACREVDGKAEAEFSGFAERVRQRIWKPLGALGLAPESVALETTADLATARLRLAAEPQLAAHTPRPRAPSDAVLAVQVHESSVNNAADRLTLAGRTLRLEALLRHVFGTLGLEPRIPDDLPEGVEVTFAEAQPLRVECRNGLVHVQVALAALQSGRRTWSDVVARVDYRPVVAGRQVQLERDGPVQIGGPGHQGRVELALRTIFGRIFPRERPVPLLPATFVANPRLAEVVALQAVCADGWFALALGERPAAAAAAPAAPRR